MNASKIFTSFIEHLLISLRNVLTLYNYTLLAFIHYSAVQNKHMEPKRRDIRAGSGGTSSRQADLITSPFSWTYRSLFRDCRGSGSSGYNQNKMIWGNKSRKPNINRDTGHYSLDAWNYHIDCSPTFTQANLNIPMGALRPGAGVPMKRREETVDTEEVRLLQILFYRWLELGWWII